MTDWRANSLGDICRFQAGDAFPKELQGAATGDVPVVKVSDMNLSGNELFISYANNWLSTPEVERDFKLHPAGAVIFAKIGVALTSNRRRILLRPTVIDNNMMSAVCTSGVDPRWFYYLLTTLDFNEVASGSALPYLTVRDLNNISVTVPPLLEQRAIAATLGALDDRIELNRKMNATLEAMARALFRDWFVDFGPTRAKMAEAAPYLAPDLWSLFPDRIDADGKPEGWEAGKMSDLFTLQRGFDLPSKDRRDGEYPILAASGPSGFHESHMVKGPGVTTGRSGVLGRVFYVHQDFWPLNTSLWVKDFRRATPLYAFQFLSLIDLAGFNAGSAVPTLNRNHVHGLPAVLPPREVILAFDCMADSLMQKHRQNEAESETLAQIRDLLLPRLMSGELRLAEVAPISEEVK